jgi:tetratricopeptide (TPR) repeat protein
MSTRFSDDEAAQRLLRVDQLRQGGDEAGCVEQLRSLVQAYADRDAWLLQEAGQRMTSLGLHVEAADCFARSLAMQPDHPEYLYNHATALIAMGRMADAETALDQVIAIAPQDSDAWYNRATLRRQTLTRNHITALERELARAPAPGVDPVPLLYALAKELEDLGESVRSFASLRRGADLRRERLAYRVEDDIQTMGLIASAFDAEFFSRLPPGHDDVRPIFIVGLPRSGSTLVDRILGSHSTVTSRGERTDFAMELVRTAGTATSKADLVRRSRKLDFGLLGKRYCAHLPTTASTRQIDKTPANFLYLGLIAAALPQASIVHIRRRPMDACYAMYKTLFRMAYPFSYDLHDLGHYWLAYERLMTHWRSLLPPECFIEIDYEDLIANQEAVTRRLLAHVGLAWEDACLSFELNAQPSLTASAAQVRQPIYSSSVALWRRYQSQLAPLAAIFRDAGVDIDPPTLGNAS